MASKSKNPTPPTTKPSAPRVTTPGTPADRVTVNNTKSPNRPAPSGDEIRARAYFLWEAAGKPECDGVQFWLEAENEVVNPR